MQAQRRRTSNASHHSTKSRSRFVLAGFIVLVVFGVVNLFAVKSLLVSSQQRQERSLDSSLAPQFEKLYGYSQKHVQNSTACTGPCQLLVLGYYNSRASLLARLLMLMGVFAGHGEQLRIDPGNQLRWWELKQVTTLNDLMLQKYASPGLPSRLARGFNLSELGRDDLDYYRDRVAGVVLYLAHNPPWLLKDPRLSWFAPLWLEQLDAPLCLVVVHLQPHLLAQQMGQLHAQQLVGQEEVDVSPYTHLERWTNATLSAIQACIAVPTIVVPSSVLAPPLLQPFMAVLQQHLKLAGVHGTRLPPDELLQQQYVAHLAADSLGTGGGSTSCKAAPAAGPNGTVDGAALLQDSCHWLPPLAGATGSSPALQGAPQLPIPTMALLETLRDHLDKHLAHPEVGVDYSKVAARLYTAYSKRVKQLVQQQPGYRAWPDHGIAALIHEALHHVANEHRLASYFKQS